MSCARIVLQRLCVACLLLCVVSEVGAAADAELSWTSLSGEQRYVLQRYRADWPRADLARRRALLARANVVIAAHAGTTGAAAAPATAGAGAAAALADSDAEAERNGEDAQAAPPSPTAAPATRRSRERVHGRPERLSGVEAVLSAHSSRLRARLRETPGLSLAERRDILERWSKLSPRQRIEMVRRYATTVIDNEELTLHRALRLRTIRATQIMRGLVTERLTPQDLAAALRNGTLNPDTLREALPDDLDIALEIEIAARTGRDPPPLDGRLIETARRVAAETEARGSKRVRKREPITDIKAAAERATTTRDTHREQ